MTTGTPGHHGCHVLATRDAQWTRSATRRDDDTSCCAVLRATTTVRESHSVGIHEGAQALHVFDTSLHHLRLVVRVEAHDVHMDLIAQRRPAVII